MRHTIIDTVIFGFISFCFISCTRSVNNTPTSVILYDKSLDSIQKYINGNWKLIYSDGGESGMKLYYDSTYWQLSSKRIKQTYPIKNGGVLIDTTVNWVWQKGVYTSGSYTYILQCFDIRSYEYDYVVMKIYNDSLILHENSIDGLFFHLIKNN